MQAVVMWEATFEQDMAVMLDRIVAEAYDMERQIAALETTIRPFLRSTASRAISAMNQDYEIGLDVTIDADFIRQLLQAQESRFAKDVSATSVRGIRDALAEGIANGEGHYQLRDRILQYYDKQAAWRAGIAAQYETGMAYEGIRGVLAARQGMSHKRWETMRDPKVEQVCLDNEAAGTIPINQAFPSGHDRPLAHPLCRCWLSYTAEEAAR